MLPTDPKLRKTYPITSGLLDYFPRACAYVAHVSYVANEQHNPGEPMHWAREKSTDHEDCITRHTLERGTIDTDKLRHTGKRAWRALAALELELEAADQPTAERRGPLTKPRPYRCACLQSFATPQGLAAHIEGMMSRFEVGHVVLTQ